MCTMQEQESHRALSQRSSRAASDGRREAQQVAAMYQMQKHGRAGARLLSHDVSKSPCKHSKANIFRCRCKHQFCYLCGRKWKRCSCPQWDEDYLTRPLPAAAPPAPARAPPRASEPAPEDCRYNWATRRPGYCQDCGADWYPWVLRCSDCAFTSCRRCI